MEVLLWVIYVLVAVAIIALILLQHGKGADMGAAFGSGASGSVFGAAGSANFLSRATSVLAAIFFAISLTLAWMSAHKHQQALQVVPSSAQPASSVPGLSGKASQQAAPSGAAQAGSTGSAPAAQDIPK
ncbi:MAG: preprotein translocase subunit SecG [Pseudomonadota bacterium]|nr:preprotein translocase subunit SecG [Pseudomonadota bacterium]